MLAFLYDFNNTNIIRDALKNLLLISSAGIALRICLKKYNLERHLEILYKNRIAVLDQFVKFEGSIGENEEAKNNLRLTIAKIIFDDPNTGLVGNEKSLNINPAVNMVDSVMKKTDS